MDPATLHKATSFAINVAKYLGYVQDKRATLLKSIEAKLDKIAEAEFEAGMRALQQAARSEAEQSMLLREARNRLNKAMSFEQGFHLILTQVGLALCHFHLGDITNAVDALTGAHQSCVPALSGLRMFVCLGSSNVFQGERNQYFALLDLQTRISISLNLLSDQELAKDHESQGALFNVLLRQIVGK